MIEINRGGFKMKFIIVLFLAVLAASMCGPVYAVEKKCDLCHIGHNAMGVLLNNDINVLCSGCHQERILKGEHRVGMSPSTVVRGLPLHNGLMTCATCHDPHSKSVAMLRKPETELCMSCHDK